MRSSRRNRTALPAVEILELRRLLAAGDLDLSFGGDGTITTDFAGKTDIAHCVALQADGKIVVGGYATPETGSLSFGLTRYLPSGDLDPTFGPAHDGRVLYAFPGGLPTQVQSIAIQPDGKIVAIGIADFSNSGTAIARFNIDGSLDGDFQNGVIHIPGASWNDGNAVVLQDDGKIVVAGDLGITQPTFNRDFSIERFKDDGSIDDDFGVHGVARTDFSANELALTVAIDSQDRIVAAGSTKDFGGKWAIARYTSTGADAGSATFDLIGSVRDILILDNNQILLVGNIDDHFAIARLNDNLTLDQTFGGNNTGVRVTTIGNSSDGAQGVAVQPNGEIVAGGYSYYTTNEENFVLARFTANGLPAATNPIVEAPISGGRVGGISAARDAAGRMVVAGTFITTDNKTYDFAAARFQGGAGSIAGNVFNDPNSNGTSDGPDSPIANWNVYLDANNNGVLDLGDTATPTDALGNYAFNGVVDLTYHVRQVLKSGYRKTSPGTGVPGYDVVVASNSHGQNNFGNTTNIRLAGRVFDDASNLGISGVVVNIVSNNLIVASRTTDAAGLWQVKGLSAGSGSAEVVAPGGYTVSSPAGGMYIGSMSSGQQNGNLNFGLHPTAAVPKTVYTPPTATMIHPSHLTSLNFFNDGLE